MTSHVVVGARGRSLMNSLAALGLVRVLAEQADARLRCVYTPDGLRIDCAVEHLATWLVDSYRPTPVLSPWNEGSGFGIKDKAPKLALSSLLAIGMPRLDAYRSSHATVAPLAASARVERWPKAKLVRAIRARCPDAMLPWLDSAVIDLGSEDRLAFPPLLGSGGNDGRLDFSTNFHQRLLDVLPASDKARQPSLALAGDCLAGTSTEELAHAAVGQFDPGGAGTPNSTPYGGGAQSVVNPWTFVLMIEGSMMFTAAAARRLSDQARASARAAMTFTTFGSSFGSATGTGVEESRGEVWLPWWRNSLSFNDVRALYSEGRAVWRGRTAVQSDQMYLAAATNGVSSGIAGFDRFTIVRRNGLAFAAVLADSIDARNDESLLLIAALEDWPNQVGRRAELPSTVQRYVGQFRAARVAMAKDGPSPARVRDLLSSVTLLELAVSRSGNIRRDLAARRLPSAKEFTRLLRPDSLLHSLVGAPEFRVALGLASIATGPLPGAAQGRTMRELLLAIDPPGGGSSTQAQWRDAAPVPGLGLLAVEELFTDIARWLAVNAGTDVATRQNEREPQIDLSTSVHGFRGPRIGVRVPPDDLHGLSRGVLHLGEIHDWFVALLALNWRDERLDLASEARLSMIDPTFALLAPFRDGVRASDRAVEAPAYGLTAQWIFQLAAGKVERVHVEAARRLRQLGREAVSGDHLARADPAHGRRIAMALLPRSANTQRALQRTTRELRPAETTDPSLPTHQDHAADIAEETS